jgi:DNA-binding transcriptional MerR regulator
MNTNGSHRIGEIAAATGVTVETLRFYEREGLLPTPVRSASGARRYGHDVVGRVRFIKQAQAVGLTLRDIHVLVKSRRNTSRSGCQKIRAVLAQRIDDIERRVREMQAFRELLADHLRACDRALLDQSIQECPTLDAIERGPVQAAGATR